MRHFPSQQISGKKLYVIVRPLVVTPIPNALAETVKCQFSLCWGKQQLFSENFTMPPHIFIKALTKTASQWSKHL
jgi:hypothetical protein